MMVILSIYLYLYAMNEVVIEYNNIQVENYELALDAILDENAIEIGMCVCDYVIIIVVSILISANQKKYLLFI